MPRVDEGWSRHHPAPPRRRPVGVVGLLLATALLLLVPTGPASAHDALEGTEPGDGTVLDTAPGQVVLTFTADQLAVGAAVAVTGPDAAEWADGAPVVAGQTVTQALAPGMPSGAYSVEWRSVSGDGHPTAGTFAFTIALPEVVTPSPTVPEPTTPTTPSATVPTPTAVPSSEADVATPQATISATLEDDAPSGGSGFALVVAGVVVLLLVAAGIAVALRRRGRAA